MKNKESKALVSGLGLSPFPEENQMTIILVVNIIALLASLLVLVRTAYLLKKMVYLHTASGILIRQIESANTRQLNRITRLLTGVLVILVSDETLQDKIKEFVTPSEPQ
jgi:hypothetical protein